MDLFTKIILINVVMIIALTILNSWFELKLEDGKHAPFIFGLWLMISFFVTVSWVVYEIVKQ